MVSVEVVTPGRCVRVGEDFTGDVLEYAEALIEEDGWNPGKRSDGTVPESTPRAGWTLHDAIGEANRRLFGGSKEGYCRWGHISTRESATQALGTDDDIRFNDDASDAAEVLGLLRSAREGVASA